MNIPLLLTPKSNVATLYDDDNLRQALEKMHHHGYSSIPVITHLNVYLGTLSEGDLLWFLYGDRKSFSQSIDVSTLHETTVSEILNKHKYSAVTIDAPLSELLDRAKNQNFVPVVDDRGCLSGIVTRSDIMKHFYSDIIGGANGHK